MKNKTISKPHYEIFLYRHHPSGIGSIYVGSKMIDFKPSFDNGFFLDVTNGKWAKWID